MIGYGYSFFHLLLDFPDKQKDIEENKLLRFTVYLGGTTTGPFMRDKNEPFIYFDLASLVAQYD